MAKITFNNTIVSAEDAPPGETTMPLAELPHLASLAKKSRSGAGGRQDRERRSGDHLSRRALRGHCCPRRSDNRLALWGEENRDWGGAFGVYRGLTELLPRHRLFNSPISEAAIVGTGVGYALSGGRPWSS